MESTCGGYTISRETGLSFEKEVEKARGLLRETGYGTPIFLSALLQRGVVRRIRRFPSGYLWSDPKAFMAATMLRPVPRRVHIAMWRGVGLTNL